MSEPSMHKAFEVPCALTSHADATLEEERYGCLPQDVYLVAFLHWAASSCRKEAEDSDFPQEIRCPLLWCREKHDDLETLLVHLQVCPGLSDGYYWCSDCSKPECFIPKLPRAALASAMQHKESKLKRAVTFFRQIGRHESFTKRRTPSRGTSVLGSPSPVPIGSQNELAELKKRRRSYQIVPADPEVVQATAKSRPNSTTHNTNSLGFDSATRRETLYTFFEDEPLSCFDLPQLESPNDNEAPFIARQSLCELDDPANGTMVELPVTEASQLQQCENMLVDCKLVSPVSQISPLAHDSASGFAPKQNVSWAESPSVCCSRLTDQASSAEKHGSTQTDSNRASSTIGNKDGVNTSIIPGAEMPAVLPYNVPKHMSLPATNRNFTMLEDSSFESAESQVEELCLLVFALNNEWMERMDHLSSTPWSRCPSLPASDLFKNGVDSLKKVYSGILPHTFNQIFALIIIACSTAYSVHKDDEQYDWRAFFNDAFQWEQAIANDNERGQFKQALSCLACCEEFQTEGSNDKADESDITSSDVPKAASRTCNDNGSTPEENCTRTRCDGTREEEQEIPDRHKALQALRNGAVARSCARFLDGLAYTRISVRNSALLPGHFTWYTRCKENNVRNLVDYLIRPLQSAKGIEALFDIILDAEFQIHMGLLRTPREVEVALLYGGKLYSKNRQFYERFQAVVNLITNWAMQEADSSWRYPYYATHLDNVLAIALEIETRQQKILDMPAVDCWPNASVLELSQDKSPPSRHNRTKSSSFGHRQSSIPTPLTATSASTTYSSVFSTCDSAGTTSTRISQASSTSKFNILPISEEGMTKCPECPATFTGSFSNRRSNLRRHMRTSLKHGGKEGHRCPELDCGLTFSRSDNLNMHIQRAHMSVEAPREPGSAKRRRGTDA